jgi:exo-beta-1,3-glucanase (GH17 family)
VPYSTTALEHSTVASSVEVVTTPAAVSTTDPIISSSEPDTVALSTTPAPASASAPPSFSLVPPEPESSSVEVESSSSSSPPPPLEPTPVTTQEPEYSSPPPAPPSSSAAAPVETQAPPPNQNGAGILPFGVTYDPFTGSGSNTICKTDAEVADDFTKINSAGYKVVRIYATDCNIVPLAVQNALKNGQTIMGGAYLSSGTSGEYLNTVISTWKSAIDNYAGGSWDVMKLFSVENERLDTHDMTASAIVDAIRRGRDQLRSVGYSGPVGAVDTVSAIIENPAVCQAADITMVNCHPFFDRNTDAAGAGTFVKDQIDRVKTACNTDRVIVTETGWPHQGESNGGAVPSLDNQAKALASIHSEFNGDVFFHNAFDSTWKSDSASTFDAERYWGVIR